MANYYYFDSLISNFTFGKHRYEPLCKVLLYDPEYIHWCVDNINTFYINPDIKSQIKDLFPLLDINDKFEGCFDYPPEFQDDDFNHFNSKVDYKERPTYERYNGSYAQDEMGYSDDDIDTIFDGDPSAYWNID